MKKASLVVSEYLQGNVIFDENAHRDNIFDRFTKLKKAFEEYGYDLATHDINSIENSEIVIYASNMPSKLPEGQEIGKSYIILSESAFIRPDNYDKNKHKHFNKIFTWADDLIDNKKYFKVNYAHLFPETINKNLENKEKLCVLISANKNPPYSRKDDLYEKRREAIRWFEKNHLNDFDLYGVGWGKYRFNGPKYIRVFNRIPYLSEIYGNITNQNYISYKGMVDNKKEVMESYKFSICYENAKDITGYITEKIFDSFFAGCVPIYWGADNVLEHVPKNCFINKRDFSSYDELYDFLQKMSDSEYLQYLNNIDAYLKSHMAYQFKSEGFVDTIIQNTVGIANDYK
ncbi:MAG: putative fucosyl transferase [uncultured Sulfurovum sp.]|uniref:Putative fucosyl transferase n=1 Tax=uncultured Sulfurovum sp. TaxID=269237 RepID=A0A6S6TIJ1_9BACT|nr:MAG: putative fucosyl transferase [uncultured Sulfurovum sp.]